MQPRSGLKKIAIRVVLVLFGCFGALFAAELLFRLLRPANPYDERPLVTMEEERAAQAVIHKPDTEFVWVGHAGLVKEFAIPSRWNTEGFNDEDHTFENPSNHFRILVLGDSYVEALEVPRHQNFHQLLEQRLNRLSPEQKFEVIALGRAGNGARRNYQWLEKLGVKYRPDLVLMEFYPTNDVVDDSTDMWELRDHQIEKFRTFSPLTYRPPIYRHSTNGSVLQHSKLFPVIAQSFLNLKFNYFRNSLPLNEQIPVQYFIYAEEYAAIWKRAWKITLNHIKKARDLSSSIGSDFVLVYFGDRFKLSEEDQNLLLKTYPAMAEFKWDFDRPHKILDHFTTANRIHYLNLEILFKEEYLSKKVPLHFEYDGHWNAAGHELAAEKILQYLTEKQLTRRKSAK